MGSETELFLPKPGRWLPNKRMHTARFNAGACSTRSATAALVAGGFNATGSLRTAELYTTVRSSSTAVRFIVLVEHTVRRTVL